MDSREPRQLHIHLPSHLLHKGVIHVSCELSLETQKVPGQSCQLLPALSLPCWVGSYTSDHLLSSMASPAAACLPSPYLSAPYTVGPLSSFAHSSRMLPGTEASECPSSLLSEILQLPFSNAALKFSVLWDPYHKPPAAYLDISFGCPTRP